MAFFPDLGCETQIARGDYVRAVGWLSDAHAFQSGDVASDRAHRLVKFAALWSESVRALDWPVAGGWHTCELCGRERAGGNFGVPAGRVLYVCPQMIAHYVRDHGYEPPQEFLDALAASPLPGTPEYATAIAMFRVAPPPR